MANSNQSNENWDACPSGQLAQVAADLRTTRRREDQSMLIISRVAAACVLLVVVGGMAIWSSQPPTHGGLTCVECQGHLVAYHQQVAKGQVANGETLLAASLVRQIEQHLSECDSCHAKYEKMTAAAIAWTGHSSCQMTANAGPAHVAMLLAATNLHGH